jgi:hypothetical protein
MLALGEIFATAVGDLAVHAPAPRTAMCGRVDSQTSVCSGSSA